MPLRHLLTPIAFALAPVAAHAQAVVELDPITILSPVAGDPDARAVSVVTGADLERAGAARVADYLARLPGITLSTTGPFGNGANLRVRGLDGRYLAVYVDGIRVSDPSGTNVAFDFGSLLAADVGRIEILRGSQSAHWGGSAVGGVIAISTREAIEDGVHQSLGVEAGDQGSARLAWGLSQRTDRAEFALSLVRFHTDGFSVAAEGTEADGADASRLSFSGRYQVADGIALGAAFFAQHTRQAYDGFPPPLFRLADTDAEQVRRETGARVFAEIEAGATRHDFDLSFYDIDRRFTEAGTDWAYSGRRLGLGWQGTTTLSDALTLIYGADWSRESVATAALPGGETGSGTAGAYAQAIWSPDGRLDLSASLRTDRNDDFGSFTTGKLTLAWRATDRTTLHAALATGFRAPSIDERHSDYGFFVGNPDLAPEKSRSFELGIEHLLAGGTRLAANLFLVGVDDLITYRYALPVSTLENVPGETVSKGFEIEAAVPLGERASLDLAYTYTDARKADGTRLTRVPYHSLSLTLGGGITDRLSGSLSVRHVGARLDNDANTFALVEMPGYTVADAQISYDLTDRARAYLRIENLGDTNYQSAQGYATSGRAVHVGLQAKF